MDHPVLWAIRNQLAALADWHLVNIIQAYDLSDLSTAQLERMPGTQLIELIVAAVRVSEEP